MTDPDSNPNSTKKIPHKLDFRLGLLLILMVAVIVTGSALHRLPQTAEPTPTLLPTYQTVTDQTAQVVQATPLPREYLENDKETIGLTLAAVALFIIVLIGFLRAWLVKPRRS